MKSYYVLYLGSFLLKLSKTRMVAIAVPNKMLEDINEIKTSQSRWGNTTEGLAAVILMFLQILFALQRFLVKT